MNNLFKNSKKVKLDDNYTLEHDGYSGIVLVFEEERIRTKKDETEEKYMFSDKWYFPRVSMALEQYVKEKQIILPTVEEMLEVQKQVLEILQNFEKNFKNW
ncbi:MAG: hypothetical protein ACK5VI_01810 [Opitutia bacterium]